MGLIKAAKDAVGSLIADQWLEYFYCSSMPSDILMMKGQKQVKGNRGNNNNGTDNIISNGSIISVNAGQCMIIVDNGKIVDLCSEPGEYKYDASTEPSLLAGNLGQSIKESFKTLGRRFTFAGDTAKDQRVYYFNTKNIMNNLYGTATPIDFHLVSPNTGLQLETTVKCNGEYSFRIVDPILFYTKYCGNVEDNFSKSSGGGLELMKLMKGELLTKLPVALGKIAAQGVLPYQIQNHTEEIVEYLKVELTEDWTLDKGIEVCSMTIVATVPTEDREKLNEWNERVLLRDQQYRAAMDTEAMSTFIKNSSLNGASGEGANAMDSMMGMMAMNMMRQNMGGMNMQGMQNAQGMQDMQGMQNMQGMQMAQGMQQPQPMQMQPASTVEEGAILGWTCPCGFTDNRGKFCMECGLPKPALDGWTCSCGKVNQGKFCPECGKKKPEGAPLYRCDKCGWEPEDPTNPPKFCPECGDVFDDNDIK